MIYIIDVTVDWSLLGGAQYTAMRRLHSWTSAAWTLTTALLITLIIIIVIYCQLHHHHHAGWSSDCGWSSVCHRAAVCWRRTTNHDSQLQYVL